MFIRFDAVSKLICVTVESNSSNFFFCRQAKRNESEQKVIKTNSTDGLRTEAKMIPCQNCTNLHKDFKLSTDLKSIHKVKTITVYEGGETRIRTNELEIPGESNKSVDKDDKMIDSNERNNDIDNIEMNTSLEENDDHQILKRSVHRTINYTRKHTAEPLSSWRDFSEVKHPIKREIPTNLTNSRFRRRKLKTKSADNNINEENKTEEDKRKATEILDKIKIEPIKNNGDNVKNVTEMNHMTEKTQDQNGTEAQHNLMTQAIIQKPNGKKVLLQEKAYSEPIRKNVRYNEFDKVDRVFKTNVNFYDDLPNYSKRYSHPSSYESDSYYKRPGSSFSHPGSSYKYFQDGYDSYPKYRSPYHDSYDHPKYKSSQENYDDHYHKHTASHEDVQPYSKYKPTHGSYEDTYSKYKTSKPGGDTMIDVMPDHDAQYEYVPMEKDEAGNGKIKQHRPSYNYNRDGYDSGYHRRPTGPSYDSGEDEHPSRGGYGYSSSPQKSYHGPNQHNEYYGRPSNTRQSYEDYRAKYKDDAYPKYEKVSREYDYDAEGDGSEESRIHQDRKSYASSKNREKPLTLKVNLDDNEDDGGSDENRETNDYDYASRDGNSGKVAARVTKVPKTLEEYHKLHRTWEKRPAKTKNTKTHKGESDGPKRKPRPVRPKPKQSPRRFPPTRTTLEKPHVSYEFEGPNSHVAMDFATPRIPVYNEHSEAFQDHSDENDESEETSFRPSPFRISKDVDSIFDKFKDEDSSFKRTTTEKPYKITRLSGKPLYSGEGSFEFTRNIVKDITPKLSQRDKEDLYDKLKHEVDHKKYKSSAAESSADDDIFKDLGLDLDVKSKGSYKSGYGLDRSKILSPKIETDEDSSENSGPRKSWSFQYP